MKKILPFLIGIILIYSCSTNNDSNGNSTTTIVPVTPSNLAGQVISITQINLSWTDNSTNETGFKIERKTGTGTYAVIGTVNENIQAFSDTGLSSNTSYTYRVYAYNSAGNSPSYSNEVIITTVPPTITDIDGNNYQLVTICNQTWTQSNLNVSHYRNGDVIPQVTDATQWANLTTGAWCYYNNDPANGAIYGKLYNWYAINDPRGLAPAGYHVPTDAEWSTLTTFLGGDAGAGDKMKATIGWTAYSGITNTNSSGFTGLSGGLRSDMGPFYSVGSNGYWWSSSEYPTSSAWQLSLRYNNSGAGRGFSMKLFGFSVRCIKD